MTFIESRIQASDGIQIETNSSGLAIDAFVVRDGKRFDMSLGVGSLRTEESALGLAEGWVRKELVRARQELRVERDVVLGPGVSLFEWDRTRSLLVFDQMLHLWIEHTGTEESQGEQDV